MLSDLNYRVDIPDPELRRLLAEKEWDGRLEVIFRYDQVNRLAVLFDPWLMNGSCSWRSLYQVVRLSMASWNTQFPTCRTLSTFQNLSFFPKHIPRTYRVSSGIGVDELDYDQKQELCWLHRPVAHAYLCRRRPAWTDRILHLPSPFCNVRQKRSNSYPKITMSDHRPVAADFSVDACLVNF